MERPIHKIIVQNPRVACNMRMRTSIDKPRIMIKSFGFGVFMAEMVPTPTVKERPNGDRKALEYQVTRMFRKSGIEFKEIIIDVEDSSRAYALAGEGHTPTKFEFAQIEPGDWERIRTSVDMWGSGSFRDRITLLEESKMKQEVASVHL